VKIDIGEVLSRSWQISWKNKWLWVIGAVMVLGGFLFLPLAFLPMMADIMNASLDDGLILLLFFGVMGLALVILYPAEVLLDVALTLGILRAEGEEERPSFVELMNESYPFLWRCFGVTTLFVGAMLLIYFAVFALMTLLSFVTMGLGMMCMWPFTILQYPLMLIWYVCMQQALTAVIVDNMSVMDAAKHSWQLFRDNIFLYVIVGLVFYLGISMISSFVMMPFMFPFFFLPMVMMESAEFGNILLILGGVCAVVLFPFFCLFQGGLTTLMKSGWVITYLRLARSNNTPVVIPQEVPA
jgi:hypothetical protein